MRREKTIKVDGLKVTAREVAIEDIRFFYQDVENYTALSGFMQGDFSGVDIVFDRLLDVSYEEIKDLGGVDFMELVRTIREVNTDFFVMLREEMETIEKTAPPAETEKKATH